MILEKGLDSQALNKVFIRTSSIVGKIHYPTIDMSYIKTSILVHSNKTIIYKQSTISIKKKERFCAITSLLFPRIVFTYP